MSKNMVIGFIAVFFLYGGMVSAVNLLTNPSFELPVVPNNTSSAAAQVVPTGWRFIIGSPGSASYIYRPVPAGTYPPTDGSQRWVLGADTAAGQDVGTIEANTVYTFKIDMVPYTINGLSGQGRISLRTYVGSRYITLAQSNDYRDLGMTYRVWNTRSIQWDSTDYPQTWGKPLTVVMATHTSCAFFYDNSSLTKEASSKKIRIARNLPQEFFAVSENGATCSFNVELIQAPTSDVSIIVDPNFSQVDVGAGVGAAVTRTFTPSNWATAQTVTVSAVDDAVAEDISFDLLAFSAVSSDPAYSSSDPNNTVASLAVKVVDNDSVGLSGVGCQLLYNGSFEVPVIGDSTFYYLAPTGWFDLTKGFGYQYNPPTTSAIQPTDGITRYVVRGKSEIMQPVGTLIEANTGYVLSLDVYGVLYDRIQIVGYDSEDIDPTVTSSIVLLGQGGIRTTATNGNGGTTGTWGKAYAVWNSSSAPEQVGKRLGVIIPSIWGDVNCDLASLKKTYINVVETNNTTDVWERASLGNTDTYTISLDRAPTSDVVITAAVFNTDTNVDLGAGAGVAVTRTFTSSDWQTPQTITVMAVDDALDEGMTPKKYIITHSVVSSDSYFGGDYIRDVNITLRDDDHAELLFTDAAGIPLSAALAVSEEGPTSAQYNVSLLIAPTADVTVSVSPGTDVTVDPNLLTFTAENWATPQTINVTAVDDMASEADPENITVAHAAGSTDTRYVLASTYVKVAVTENDFCGAWGFYPEDINKDCYVNIDDLQVFVLSWLDCSNPIDVTCTQP